MDTKQKGVMSPYGVVTVADLPSAGERWTIRRKTIVATAISGGILSIEEACKRYDLSVDEFMSWQRLLKKHGVQGLRATRTQEYRG